MSITPLPLRCALAGLVVLTVTALGCEQAERPMKQGAAAPAGKSPAAKKVSIGNNVVLEIDGSRRRVLVNASVCRREDYLEQLLCRKLTKEHESVLTADIDARHLHAALLAAGLKPGKPVRYDPEQPKPKPPTGDPVKVSLEYKGKDGQTVRVPAQAWVRHIKTKKNLDRDWVFAGSMLFPDPEKKNPPSYGANDGNVICVANFETALLDLPFDSSKEAGGLLWEAHTERIPPLGTPVLVIFEPAAKKK